MYKQEMNKRDNVRIVTLIERAERETPFCDCGEPMAATARGDQIWLACTAHQRPQGGRIRRFIAALASAEHTRRLIVDPV